MGWLNDFLDKLFPVRETYGPQGDTVTVDIPAELYYKELALYTGANLIANAISRSEIRTYIKGEPARARPQYSGTG